MTLRLRLLLLLRLRPPLLRLNQFIRGMALAVLVDYHCLRM
jgi:hypothetical protein